MSTKFPDSIIADLARVAVPRGASLALRTALPDRGEALIERGLVRGDGAFLVPTEAGRAFLAATPDLDRRVALARVVEALSAVAELSQRDIDLAREQLPPGTVGFECRTWLAWSTRHAASIVEALSKPAEPETT